MTALITKSTVPILLLLVAPALLLSCPDRTAKTPPKSGETSVRLNEEFTLKVGQQAIVKAEKLKLKFVSVENDSRCPRDVTCVWAGNAEVKIQIEANGKTADLKLNTSGAANFPKEASYQKYRITLAAFNPQKLKDKEIKSTDYTATLVIRKQ